MPSTLDTTGESKPIVNKGHGTDALGPSDTSDSGSDIVGGPGIHELDEALPLDRGTSEDFAPGGRRATAGADIGDGNLDSDSDAAGTGERAGAGKDDIATNRDIRPDRIEKID
ncbi:MAG TPA: hypothetical protein VJU83_06390 [Burkholderiales bacterium]|nr:hypothetical protein [Burkholderiales bacterium]